MQEQSDFPGCCGVVVNHNLRVDDVGGVGENEGETAVAVTAASQRLEKAMRRKGYVALATFKNPGTGSQLTLWILFGKKGGAVLCKDGSTVIQPEQKRDPALVKLDKLVDVLLNAKLDDKLDDISSLLADLSGSY